MTGILLKANMVSSFNTFDEVMKPRSFGRSYHNFKG